MAHTLEDARRNTALSHVCLHVSKLYTIFHAFYQLCGSDVATAEPRDGGELSYEGSHSPFGVVWQIATATGWSVDYILWGLSYQLLQLMLSDAPRYLTKEERKKRSAKQPKTLEAFFAQCSALKTQQAQE